MKHIIRKQIIDLEVDKKLDAFSIQQEVSRLYHNDIVPVLEKVFNDLCGDDEVLSIDQLEISLGNITADELNRRWDIEKILSVITSQLYDKIQGKATAQGSVKRQPKASGIFRQWLYYMEKGFLPWNATAPNNEWYEKVLESLATEYQSAEQLRSLIGSNEMAVERIILQHPTGFLVHLATLLTTKDQERLPEYIEEVFQAFLFTRGKESFAPVVRRSYETLIWKKVFFLSAHSYTTELSTETIIEKLVELYFDKPLIQKLARINSISSKLPLILPILKKIEGKLPEESNELQGKDFPVVKEKNVNEERNQIEEGKTKDQEAKDIPSTPLNKIEEEIAELTSENKQVEANSRDVEKLIEEEGIFAVHAGIVLLHPFLPHLFSNLRLVQEGKFTGHNNHQKALHLLHYLATGSTEAKEHELVMAKLICAYPMEQPVDGQIILTGEELTESDQMLREVIAQWTILKNTSPDGLREGFLQRAGKLYSKNDLYFIHLETSTIDILLDHLPWNLSIVKLPWMKKRLMVEWR